MMTNEMQRFETYWTHLDFMCLMIDQAAEYFQLLQYLDMEVCLESTLGQYYLWEWN